MNLLAFELKKIWRRKQFLVLALIAIACVAVIFLRNFWAQDDIVDKTFHTLASHSQSVFKIGSQFKDEMIFRTEDKAFMDAYENSRKMAVEFGKWQEAIRKKQWEEVPESEMAFIQTVFKHMEWGDSYDGYPGNELEQSFEKNKILLEHSLPFEDDTYSISTPNFMKIVFTFLLSVPALGILVLLLGDQMVMEKDNNTIRTLSTQPITKWRLLFGKFISQLSTVVVALFVIILACFAVPFFFGGQMGSFSYPQSIQLEDGFDFIPIGHYLVLNLLLFLGTASFFLSLSLLFGTVFQDRISVIIFTLLVLFGGVFLTNQFSVLQSFFNPYYYLRFQELIEQPNQLGKLLMIIPYLYALIIVMISATLQKKMPTAEKGKKDSLPYKIGAISKTGNWLFIASIFEWRKYKREGVLKRFSVIILLLIVGGYAFIAFSINQLREQYFSNANASISFTNNLIVDFEQLNEDKVSLLEELEQKSTLTSSEETLKESTEIFLVGHRDAVSRFKNEMESLQMEITAYELGDRKTVHEFWIQEIMLWWKDPVYVNYFRTERPGGGISDFTFMASVQEKEWMIENNLMPVHTNHLFRNYTWSIYDRFISKLDQLEWNEDTRKVDKTGLFYVYTFFTTYSYLILAGLLVFVLGAGMTSEKGIKRTLTLLRTQPLTKSAIFMGKTGVSMLLTAAISLFSILFMVLLGTIGDRFGDWNFPVLYYDSPSVVDSANYSGFKAVEGGFHFMYMGRFLLETSALFLAGIVFLIAVSHFVAMFFNNTMSALMTTLIIAVGGYVVSTSSLLVSVAQWSPFTYFNVGKIANGELAAVLTNESISTNSGIIVLLVGAFIFVGAGTLWFRSWWMKVV